MKPLNRWFWCIGTGLALTSSALAACISDSDGDGVCDSFDLCPETVPGALVDSDGCPIPVFGDSERDGDVDPDDFAVFANCQLGPGIPSDPFCQEFEFDLDADTDVDVSDFAGFQRCFSGYDEPADPQCAGDLVFLQDQCLHILGTAAGANLALRLKAGFPTILEVDLGDDGLADYNFNRDDFDCILINARGGDDVVWIDESFGAFTDTETTTIHGGRGDDTLLGGSGAETCIGGPGADSVFQGAGNDLFVWNPGDGSDLLEGATDSDTVQVNGDDLAEAFTITANGTRVRFDRLSPDAFFLDIGTTEHLVVNGRAGNDTLACTGNLASLILITADGGTGDDTLLGSNGADLLLGGDGNDLLDGNQGNDTVLLGAGDDVFQWDPGDGSDVVEAETGHDSVDFNGSSAAEIFDVSANGPRLRFTRTIGSIVLDAADVEQFDLRAFGGSDILTVNDLAGTGLLEVNVDLAVAIGGGDAAQDYVVVYGTAAGDELTVHGSDTNASVSGMPAVVNVATAEPSDWLMVAALAGDDRLDASDLAAGVVSLQLNGGFGDDVLIGSSGVDFLYGDEDEDSSVGGPGNDYVYLGSGDDIFTWDADDNSDIIDGDEGADLVEVIGDDVGEGFTITANGERVRFDRLDPAPFFLDIGTTESVVLLANGGNDTLACTGNLAALTQITAYGGPGADTLLGSNGGDYLLGGDDTDFIDGNQGNDTVLLGAGDDVFQWDPGDGSDVVGGEDGYDLVRFNGSSANENYDFSDNASHLRFTRDVGSIVLDAHGMEQFDLQTLGGSDTATVHDVSGTELVAVNVNLAGTLGGSSGDAATDHVFVFGTDADDELAASGSGTSASVDAFSVLVNVLTAEVALDRLTLNGLAGSDVLDSSGLAPGVIGLTLSGGVGDDLLLGGSAVDQLNGDEDNDTISSGPGNDFVLLGAGNDVFDWIPGDDSDVVDGNDGSDTVQVNGDDGAEEFTITANGTRVRFDRLNPDPFFLDIGTTENLVLLANGGNDSLSCTGNLASLILISADGGAGSDTLRGSNGGDHLLGGPDDDFIDGNQGADIVLLGAGNDFFQWDPGDGSDLLEGEEGYDAVLFNGSATNEIFDFTNDASRLLFTRNVGSVFLDAGTIEQFDLRTLSGSDTVTVNDLNGTGLTEVNIDLAGTFGGEMGDALPDAITVNGTAAADTIHVSAAAGVVGLSGLAATVGIVHSEAASDSLVVNGLDGTDTITADSGVAALIMLFINP